MGMYRYCGEMIGRDKWSLAGTSERSLDATGAGLNRCLYGVLAVLLLYHNWSDEPQSKSILCGARKCRIQAGLNVC